MKTNKQAQIEARNKKIIRAWEKNLTAKNPKTKGVFAEAHGVSHRTLNRILDEKGLKDSNPPTTKKPTAVKKKKATKKVVKTISEKAEELPKKAVEPEKAESSNEDGPATDEKVETEKEAQRELEEAEEQPTAVEDESKEEVSDPEETPIVVGEVAEPKEETSDDKADETKKEVLSWTVGADQFISLLLTDGDTVSVSPEHEKFNEIRECLFNNNLDKALLMSSTKVLLQNFVKGCFEVRETGVYVHGTRIQSDLADYIKILHERAEPFEHLLKFLENVMLNSSEHIYKTLWKLIKASGVTITEDGYVECFKVVDKDYKDCYTGKMDNSIGSDVFMPRAHVIDNPNVTCARGLHVCAFGYLDDSNYGSYKGSHGNRVVKCVVKPQDFVTIPPDYKFTKARTCAYKVVADVTEEALRGDFSAATKAN